MLSTGLRSNLDTILFVLEPYGEGLNGPTLIHAIMQIDLDDSPDCNSSGSQRDQGDPCGGGEQDEYLLKSMVGAGTYHCELTWHGEEPMLWH